MNTDIKKILIKTAKRYIKEKKVKAQPTIRKEENAKIAEGDVKLLA